MRWPCVRCHAIFVFAEACSCFRLRASLDEGIVRRRFLHSCRFLWSVVVAFPTRRRFIDGGRALRARSAEDCETAIRKRIARTVVDDGDESARTGGAAKVAVCMYEEQKRKSRFKSVQLYSCSVHAMEYLYEYIYIAQDDNTTAVAWPKAGFLRSKGSWMWRWMSMADCYEYIMCMMWYALNFLY